VCPEIESGRETRQSFAETVRGEEEDGGMRSIFEEKKGRGGCVSDCWRVMERREEAAMWGWWFGYAGGLSAEVGGGSLTLMEGLEMGYGRRGREGACST
ncbi:hypothetical protein HAX54_033090, partial [Datura stramonium]|nr:hypothetical protein [Datura stramonium]